MKYYDIKDDFKLYPDAWAYIVWSKRGPGKTYSTLRYCIENNVKFVFIKRTIEDVKMLCATSNAKKNISFDVSPFVPLNRDFGWNIKPVKVEKGLAGFYKCNENNEPEGCPVGYCVALSIASDVKGFDLSECDLMIFDEFIPKRYERVRRDEGDALLDIYMTIQRDRLERGREELKLICLANATSINNPTFIILEIMDTAAEMDVYNKEYYYDQRRIMMHKIPPTPISEREKSGIEIAMDGTQWAEMAMGGSFSYDDFSNVSHVRLKGYQPLFSILYRKKTIYIYQKDGFYYATYAKGKIQNTYDLSKENDQKRCFFDWIGRLRNACMMDRFKFESYTMYDLIVNYKKIFNI